MKVRKKWLCKKVNLFVNSTFLSKLKKFLFSYIIYLVKFFLFIFFKFNIFLCNSSLWDYSSSFCKCSNKGKFSFNSINSYNSNCIRLEGRIQYSQVKLWLFSFKDRFFSSKCYKFGNKYSLFSNSYSLEECRFNSKLLFSSNYYKFNNSYNQVRSGLFQDI